ncbi:MAG TPA: HD domain-containing protein [Terracidiphilus sp.]
MSDQLMHDQQLHLTDRFTIAVEYARILHIERRKGRIPSMAHLLGVASLVLGETGQVPFPVTEEMVMAALLHDAAEDHGGKPRLRDIESNFGAEVARMVEGLSDSLTEDPNQKEPWEERKAAYLSRLRSESPQIKLISAADKLYNARTILDEYRSIGPRVWERFKRGRDQQTWYFQELLKLFRSAETNRIVQEFERVVGDLEKLSAAESRPDSVQRPSVG